MLKGDRCLTPKCALERRRKTTGKRRRRVSDRGLQLIEKQKARCTYGLMERQFKRVFDVALKPEMKTEAKPDIKEQAA